MVHLVAIHMLTAGRGKTGRVIPWRPAIDWTGPHGGVIRSVGGCSDILVVGTVGAGKRVQRILGALQAGGQKIRTGHGDVQGQAVAVAAMARGFFTVRHGHPGASLCVFLGSPGNVVQAKVQRLVLVFGIFTAQLPDVSSVQQDEDDDGGHDGDATKVSFAGPNAWTGKTQETYTMAKAIGIVSFPGSLLDLSQAPLVSSGPQVDSGSGARLATVGPWDDDDDDDPSNGSRWTGMGGARGSSEGEARLAAMGRGDLPWCAMAAVI